MAIEPTASQRGSPVTWASSTPISANTSPIERADVLEQHDGQLGLLRSADPVPATTRSSRADLAGLLVGRAQRETLEHDGEQEDADGDAEVLDLVGVAQLLDALVEGEQPAHREQHEGDDERPEVALAPVAERVVGVGGLGGPLAAEEQEQLVAGVGEGVDRLGEQPGRAGDQEADELGDGDAEVGEERGEDRPPAAVIVHRPRLPQPPGATPGLGPVRPGPHWTERR